MSEGGQELQDHGKFQENGSTGQDIFGTFFVLVFTPPLLNSGEFHQLSFLANYFFPLFFLFSSCFVFFFYVIQEAVVLRDGEKHTVTAEKLVLGDIIFVKFGDRVPADIRVIEARGFKVNA